MDKSYNMDASEQNLEKALREYFSKERSMGFCCFFHHFHQNLYLLFKSYARKWPHALIHESGKLRGYFIPDKIGNSSVSAAVCSFDRESLEGKMHLNPLRLDLANFILKEICGEGFVPISLDESH